MSCRKQSSQRLQSDKGQLKLVIMRTCAQRMLRRSLRWSRCGARTRHALPEQTRARSWSGW